MLPPGDNSKSLAGSPLPSRELSGVEEVAGDTVGFTATQPSENFLCQMPSFSWIGLPTALLLLIRFFANAVDELDATTTHRHHPLESLFSALVTLPVLVALAPPVPAVKPKFNSVAVPNSAFKFVTVERVGAAGLVVVVER